MRYFRSLVVAASVAFGGAAQAAVMDITDTTQADTFMTFATPGAPGVHGLEVRGGDSGGAATWEIGLGKQTSTNSANFKQAQQNWGSKTAPTLLNFEYIYSGATTDFFLWEGASKPATPKLSFSGLSTGNAIEIGTKRLATIALTELDGHNVSYSLGSITDSGFGQLILAADSFADGFTMKGTMQVVGGGNSANGIVIKTGTVETAPVPLPAALPLLVVGLGGLVALRRRR